MMNSVIVELSPDERDRLWDHLLSDTNHEQAAFGYLQAHATDGMYRFRLVDWAPVPPTGFESRSAYYMELTDAARAGAIKHAHDLRASLAEFHSHLGPWPAAFSGSDWSGFEEFVPHVWWRLKGRPYLAIVAAGTTFDALAWVTNPTQPQRVEALEVGGVQIRPTGLSSLAPIRYDTGSF